MLSTTIGLVQFSRKFKTMLNAFLPCWHFISFLCLLRQLFLEQTDQAFPGALPNVGYIDMCGPKLKGMVFGRLGQFGHCVLR